jgi:hypothetical protein
VAAVWALIVLSLLSVVLAAITQQTMSARRALEQRRNRTQAMWLARAGLELAVARLLVEPAGWSEKSLELIPASEMRIKVLPDKERPGSFQVSVEASYPTSNLKPAKRLLERRYRRTVEKGRVRIEMEASDQANTR